MNNLNFEYIFPCPVYYMQNEEFLHNASISSNRALEEIKKQTCNPNELYPVFQTGNLFDDEMQDFIKYINETAWSILDNQGFNMSNLQTVTNELWCQEHYKYSGMDEHVHGLGSQIVGFYFLETPDDCSKVIFHDARPAKKQINLPEKKSEDATVASHMINYTPKPGMLIFANSWLPHSFSRNGSDKPMKFIHFTIGVEYAQPKFYSSFDAEVI